MDQVIELLARLLPAGELSEEQLSAALTETGWSATGPATPHPRTWQNGTVEAWIPQLPAPTIEFILWLREVDEDWGDEGLDPIYDEAVEAMREFIQRMELSELASHLTPFEGDATDGVDYIEYRAWGLGKMTFLLGAKQDDTELPVVVVAVLSQR